MDLEWRLREIKNRSLVKELSKELNLPEVISKLLTARNIQNTDEAINFLQTKLENLQDLTLIDNMENAVKLACSVIKKKSTICLYVYNHISNILVLAILYKALKYLSVNVTFFIKDDQTELPFGKNEMSRIVKEHHPKLIICVNCGADASEEIRNAKEKYDIEFVVYDKSPMKFLNSLDLFTFLTVSSSSYITIGGIAYKFIKAIYNELEMDSKRLIDLLPLVSIEIISRMAPLLEENRILVYEGLREMNSNPSPALKTLFDSIELNDDLSPEIILNRVLPLVSALIKMDSARITVNALVSDNFEEPNLVMKSIKRKTDEWKLLKQKTYFEVLKIAEDIDEEKKSALIIISNKAWDFPILESIVIKISEKFNKPVVLMTSKDGLVKGISASTGHFDLINIFSDNDKLLLYYDGCESYVKVTLLEKNLSLFIKAFEHSLDGLYTKGKLKKIVRIDSSLNFNDLNPRFIRLIKLFCPFGPSNLKPIFITKHVKVLQDIQVIKNKHLLFDVIEGKSNFNVIAYNMVDKLELLYQKRNDFNLIYSVTERIWKGVKSIQLIAVGVE
jgi:single-stranded-DNA-specific exonuclease